MTRKRNKSYFDLLFVITGAKFNVFFEPGYITENLQNKIHNIIDGMSREITIDRSYVDCVGNCHSDVFLTFEGWEGLKTVLLDTNYGEDATEMQNTVIDEMYQEMALGYIVLLIEHLYPNVIQHMSIELSNRSKLHVDIYEDTSLDWARYPGPWQQWFKVSKGKQKNV